MGPSSARNPSEQADLEGEGGQEEKEGTRREKMGGKGKRGDRKKRGTMGENGGKWGGGQKVEIMIKIMRMMEVAEAQ